MPPTAHAGGYPDDGAAIRRELDEARGLFESKVADHDAQVRGFVVQVLTAFLDADAASAMGVQQRYFAEEDLGVRHDLLEGLTRVRAAFSEWPAFLGMALDRESEPENRFLIRYAQVAEWGMDTESRASQ